MSRELTLTNEDVRWLQLFLEAVDEHKRCRPVESETHGYWAESCLNAILCRFDKYKIPDIQRKLEDHLLKR